MKLIFASDIHGSLPVTERVLGLFVRNGARWLVILGGVLNHGPRNALLEGYASAKVVERFSEVAHRVIAMHGNCDSKVDQILLHFPITAPWRQVLPEKQRLFLTHGHPLGPESLPALNQDNVLVYGHTHLPVAEQRREIFRSNPDSVSISKSGNPAGYSMPDNDVFSVIVLDDRSIIAQVAINP